MVTIEKLNRAYKTEEVKHVARLGYFTTHYIETEKEFIKGIENFCNTIGEENIISIQFLNGEQNEICACVLTYKE
jgi:hypothetical protein